VGLSTSVWTMVPLRARGVGDDETRQKEVGKRRPRDEIEGSHRKEMKSKGSLAQAGDANDDSAIHS